MLELLSDRIDERLKDEIQTAKMVDFNYAAYTSNEGSGQIAQSRIRLESLHQVWAMRYLYAQKLILARHQGHCLVRVHAFRQYAKTPFNRTWLDS